jgi:Holliday junction DNA helicase RuvA
MISSLHGTLVHKSPTEVTVNVNGVGYGVHIPLSTYEALGVVNAPVSLFTYLHVREDTLQLYGFASEAERDLFRLLISVTGIGPKMAQGILSGIPVHDLRNYIAMGNLGALTTIPGVGRKLAERLVVELRDKMSKVELGAGSSLPVSDQEAHVRSEALLALTSLGYNRATAEKALRAALQETDGRDISIELLIKAALRHATK